MATSSTLTTLYGILVVLAVVFVFLSWTRGGRYVYANITAALDDPSRLSPQARPELWDVWLKGGVDVWEGMKPVSAIVVKNTSAQEGPLVSDDPVPNVGQQLWQRVGGLMHLHTDHQPAAHDHGHGHDHDSPPHTKLADPEPQPTSPTSASATAPPTQTLQVSIFIQMPAPTASIIDSHEGHVGNAHPPSNIPPLLLGVSTITIPFRDAEVGDRKPQDSEVVPEAAGSSRRWDLSHL